MGYFDIFTVDYGSVQDMEWFDHLTSGVTWTDFFALRPTDYSKANEGEDWSDMF
jgi:ribonucleotide reductase beta subunit family protein with ferritin-like domain